MSVPLDRREVVQLPKPAPRTKAKRKRINPVSDRKLADADARRECVAIVVARDHVCQWPVLQRAYLETHPEDLALFDKVPRCDRGELTAHEPKHVRNVGRLNPAESIASCWLHNGLADGELYGLARLIGFIVPGNGEPTRQRRRSL